MLQPFLNSPGGLLLGASFVQVIYPGGAVRTATALCCTVNKQAFNRFDWFNRLNRLNLMSQSCWSSSLQSTACLKGAPSTRHRRHRVARTLVACTAAQHFDVRGQCWQARGERCSQRKIDAFRVVSRATSTRLEGFSTAAKAALDGSIITAVYLEITYVFNHLIRRRQDAVFKSRSDKNDKNLEFQPMVLQCSREAVCLSSSSSLKSV